MAVNYDSANMRAIRGSRTSAELLRAITPISSVVSGFVREASMLSTSATKVVSLDDIRSTQPVSAVGLPSVVDLSKVSDKALQSGEGHSKRLENLTQAIEELNVAYQIVNSDQFSSFKSRKDVVSSLSKLLTEARNSQVSLMNNMKVQKDAVPDEHKKTAAIAGAYLKKILSKESYSAIKQQTFVATSPRKGHALFQTYVFVNDFVNTDGVHYPKYSLVFSTDVDRASGDAHHFVTTLTDMQTPGSFPLGSEVTTTARMKSSVNNLLAVDGFLNYSDQRVIPATTSDVRNSALGLKRHKMSDGTEMDIVDGVRVQNDRLYVRLVVGLSPKEKSQAVDEVRSMALAVLGQKGSSSRYRVNVREVTGRQGRLWLEVTTMTKSGGTTAGLVTVARLKRVQELLGLTDAQMRAVKQSMK